MGLENLKTAATREATLSRATIVSAVSICVMVTAGWYVARLGRLLGRSDTVPRTFRVSGSSMVPTLVGEFRTARCADCRLHWLIEASDQNHRGDDLSCAHCGQPLELLNASEAESNVIVADSDVVTIETVSEMMNAGRRLARGDLVAVRREGSLHIKRIAALPGDTVSLRDSRLLVNGVRVEDAIDLQTCQIPLPWILVDDDRHRDQSRWSIERTKDTSTSGWTRIARGQWSAAKQDSDSWLVYGHRSGGRGNLPSPVWDDYPFNVSIDRLLFNVDRLRLGGTPSSDIECDIAFWAGDGNVLASRSFSADQDFSVSYYDGAPADDLPVSPQHPVAIRITRGAARLTDLVIERLVEYRIRPHDDRSVYPLALDPNQWFLLGDNVPVSTDSRQWGPQSESQIIGRVKQRVPMKRRFVIPLP